MKTTPLTLTLAAVIAAGATGAAAQTSYGQAYQTYQQQQAAYQAQQSAYTTAQAKYETDRAAYDARYGYGAYERAYGAFRYTAPTTYGYGTNPYTPAPYAGGYPYGAYPQTTYPYSTTPSPYGSGYGTPYGYGYGTTNPYNAGAYGVNSAYGTMPCTTTTSSSSGNVNLSILGALAQAALGGRSLSTSSVSQAVLGSQVSGSVGARTANEVKCDARGLYFTRNQTRPYREGYYDQRGTWRTTPTPSMYANCRLAPAPTTAYGSEYRYVRVCPDENRRYRITG